jgi:hypothetical protein
MKKLCKWHKVALYSLIGLAVAAFSYASTFVQSQSWLVQTDVLGSEGPVFVEETFPSEDSVVPVTYSPL